MAKVKIKLDSPGIRAMLQSSGIRDDMLARADRVADIARASAPVASGAYRDSIEVYAVTTDRAVGRVGSDVAHAMGVEARTGNLARALDGVLGDLWYTTKSGKRRTATQAQIDNWTRGH